MKKLSLLVFFALSAICLAQEEKKKPENLFIDGSKLPKVEKYKAYQVRDVVTDFNDSEEVCSVLKVEKINGKVIATPSSFVCFTWIFRKKGKVVALKGIQGQGNTAYEAYSSDPKIEVGITCDCFLFD